MLKLPACTCAGDLETGEPSSCTAAPAYVALPSSGAFLYTHTNACLCSTFYGKKHVQMTGSAIRCNLQLLQRNLPRTLPLCLEISSGLPSDELSPKCTCMESNCAFSVLAHLCKCLVSDCQAGTHGALYPNLLLVFALLWCGRLCRFGSRLYTLGQHLHQTQQHRSACTLRRW
jgi:hypothetical protein